jgi:hypothetical protein
MSNLVTVEPRHPSRFDGTPIQLFRTEIDVENVLRGDAVTGRTTIFFYMYVGNTGGADTLASMKLGERDVFFLIPDSGNLRIACDGWRWCVPLIQSGPHPHFVMKRDGSVEDAIAQIALSRGEGATDQMMIDAIRYGYTTFSSYAPIIKQLKALRQTETLPVRAEADKILKVWDPDERGKKDQVR